MNRDPFSKSEALISNTYSLITHPEFLKGDIIRNELTESLIRNASQNKSDTRIRKVSFSFVEERQYGNCLGDNPSCKRGPPISLSWARTKGCMFSIAEYEGMRRRRRRSQLIIPAERREELLLNMGYTVNQLDSVESEIRNRQIDNKKHLDKLLAMRGV